MSFAYEILVCAIKEPVFLSSPNVSRPCTPKSDSELLKDQQEDSAMLWSWGELPQAAKVRIKPTHWHIHPTNSNYNIHVIWITPPIINSYLLHNKMMYLQPSFLSSKPNVLPACPLSIPVSDNTHFRVIPDTAVHGHDRNRTLHSDGQSNRAACVMSAVEKGGANTGPRPQNKTDSPSIRKGY